MVSSFALSCVMVHDGVMRRSVARAGSFEVECEEAVEMMTETSAGVGWNDILSVSNRRDVVVTNWI